MGKFFFTDEVKLSATWIIWGGMKGCDERDHKKIKLGVIMLKSLIWLKPGENT